MAARLMIINGPNLNYLGIREPHIYGHTTLAEIEAACRRFADDVGIELSFHQSNFEGAIVELIQSARESADAVIINPAAYSFTSIAIIDAIKIFDKPIIELHISNIHARDELHRHSKISAVCDVGDLRARPVRLHRRDAGRLAGAGQIAGPAAGLFASKVQLRRQARR